MTDKPGKIQRYRSHSDCREIPILGLQHGSYLKKDDTGPAVLHSDHIASLSRMRSLLKAKAKEWQESFAGKKVGADHYEKDYNHAAECDRTAELIQEMATELLALAATLGGSEMSAQQEREEAELAALQSRCERLEAALRRLVTATDAYDKFLSDEGMHEGPNDSFAVEKEVSDAMDEARAALSDDAGEGV